MNGSMSGTCRPSKPAGCKTSIDQRSDIYSLGIVLYRLLTGTLPFDGSDPMQIIDGHVAKQPALPAELRDTIPAGLFKVILKALAKSPERRYQSANGLVADLVECRSLLRSTGTSNSSNLDVMMPRLSFECRVVSMDVTGKSQPYRKRSKRLREQGRPALLLVSGAPGVGKSALLGELEDLSARRTDGSRWVSSISISVTCHISL